MDHKIESEKLGKNNLKFFFIKLISISVAIILIINFLFNMILSERLEKIDQFLNVGDKESRFEIRDKIREEIEKGLKKDNIISEQDKILLYKLYKKIQKEFEDLNKN
tara:strand:- start:788 stop:1108 length:321 start_codon:yes stop_codon:yes gene_type:complete